MGGGVTFLFKFFTGILSLSQLLPITPLYTVERRAAAAVQKLNQLLSQLVIVKLIDILVAFAAVVIIYHLNVWVFIPSLLSLTHCIDLIRSALLWVPPDATIVFYSSVCVSFLQSIHIFSYLTHTVIFCPCIWHHKCSKVDKIKKCVMVLKRTLSCDMLLILTQAYFMTSGFNLHSQRYNCTNCWKA